MKKLNEVERVALHLVDRKLPEPRYSKEEVDLESFRNEADQEALDKFFEGHINKAWDAPESRRTFAASFLDDSPLPAYKEDIESDPGIFFERSQDLAKRLHTVSKGLSTSAGLLMVILFSRMGRPGNCLGLFKMDPGPSYKIIVQSDEAEEALLQLAVRRVAQALPDPRDQVLKWALLPHPERPTYHVKAKDQEGGIDTAQYFLKFLGCETQPTEQKQIRGLLDVIPEYTALFHPQEDWKLASQDIETRMEEKASVNNNSVIQIIKETLGSEKFNKKGFEDTLKKHNVGDFDISARALKKTQLMYKLPGGIVVKGPRLAMETSLNVVETDDGFEIRIKTAKRPKKNYV